MLLKNITIACKLCTNSYTDNSIKNYIKLYLYVTIGICCDCKRIKECCYNKK